MKTFNESKYEYLGTWMGNHVFQNTKFNSEKVLVDKAQYNLLDGSVIYFDPVDGPSCSLEIDVFRRKR